MRILENKDHFIHKKVNLELYREGDYFELLKSYNIPLVSSTNKESNYSLVDWEEIMPKYSFFYD